MKNNIDDLVQEVYFTEDYYTYDNFTNEQLQIIMSNQREHIDYLQIQLSEYKRFFLLFTTVSIILLLVVTYLG
jgi:hypothetical protein